MAGRPTFVKLALVGLLLYAFAILLVFTALVFDTSAIGFAVFLIIPFAIVGAAIYFWRPWGLVIGVLGGLFGLFAFGPDSPPNLGAIDSFYDFTFTLLILVAVVFILVGSAGGLIQYFQHKETSDVSSTQRSAVMGIIGIVAVLGVVSLVVTVVSRDSVSAADEQGATIVIAQKALFDVEEIRASGSGTTKIVVKNKDPFLHTFTVDELGIDVRLGPGSEKLIELNSPASGTHEFKCTVTGHTDMVGNIIVQ